MKLTELSCPACGGTMKMDEDNSNVAVCEYCKTRYILEGEEGDARLGPEAQWNEYRPIEPKPQQEKNGWEAYGWKRIALGLGVLICVSTILCVPGALRRRRELAGGRQASAVTSTVGAVMPGGQTEKGKEEPLTGILAVAMERVFGKPAQALTEEELAEIKWLECRYKDDFVMVGYSLSSPGGEEAELQWLELERDSAVLDFKGLPRFTGLEKLSVNSSLSRGELDGLHLKSLGCYSESPVSVAGLLEDPSQLEELEIKAGLKNLEGLEQFSSLRKLSVYGSDLKDIRALVHGKSVKELILENCDEVADFSVFAVMPWLEGLSVGAEGLKSLDFLAALPHLKSLELEDAGLLTLAGLERRQDTLENLRIEDCDELRDCKSISALTGLLTLSLEVPYGCAGPELSGLTGLRELTVSGVDSVSFLREMPKLRRLSLNSAAVEDPGVFSGLTQLEELTCSSYSGNQGRLDFIAELPSLRRLDLTGVSTYYDISGILNMPTLQTLLLNGAECEINFDRLKDNSALTVIEMDGVKLYKNVKTQSDGAVLYVDWDDVVLDEHTDFLKHYPNLEDLSLADNELTRVDFAAGLMKLRRLDISDNYITDLKPLTGAASLKQVLAGGNPVENSRVLGERVNLVQ